MKKIKTIFNSYVIILLLIAVGILMFFSCLLVVYNKRVMEETMRVQDLAEKVRFELAAHLDVLRHLDVSLRGFALVRDERYLYIKPEQLNLQMEQTFARMDSLLRVQEYHDTEGLKALADYQATIRTLVKDGSVMVQHLRNREDSLFMEIFFQDKGSFIGPPMAATDAKILGYQDKLKGEAQARYQAAMEGNIYIQLFMVLLGVPSIGLVIYRMQKNARSRRELLKELEQNNFKYLFNPGDSLQTNDPGEIIESSISNYQQAFDIITKISDGNYEVQWSGLDESNLKLNESSLAGKLLLMREKMIRVKQEDDQRNWTNEGLSALGELLRKSSDLTELTDSLLTSLVKYVHANQGALFIVKGTDSNEPYLELRSTYAYNRKKYINKQVIQGEGLAGQVWLEKETVLLTDIPRDYVHITSGMGGANPNAILIVPLLSDDKVVGVLELASFNHFEPYKIAFIEKIAQSIASTLTSLQINDITKTLLEKAQQQGEEMKAQEEEMRQNMEELEATQEEMRRKEQHFLAEIEALKQQLKRKEASTV